MTTRIINEFGITYFEHEGWTITTYEDRDDIDVTVDEGIVGVEIDASVNTDGLYLRGTDLRSSEGLSDGFTVPWQVLGEIARIRLHRAENPYPTATCTRCGSDDPRCICYAR